MFVKIYIFIGVYSLWFAHKFFFFWILNRPSDAVLIEDILFLCWQSTLRQRWVISLPIRERRTTFSGEHLGCAGK